MSIMHTLLRYIDVIQHMEKEEDSRKKREVRPSDVDEDDLEGPLPPPTTAPMRRCRICGHEGQDKYCPSCLAETMVALGPGAR
jgi:rubrerythrin